MSVITLENVKLFLNLHLFVKYSCAFHVFQLLFIDRNLSHAYQIAVNKFIQSFAFTNMELTFNFIMEDTE